MKRILTTLLLSALLLASAMPVSAAATDSLSETGMVFSADTIVSADKSTATDSENYSIAQIGTKSYSSLSDAVSAAKSGDTISLLTDIIDSASGTENITIPTGISITINGSGHILNAAFSVLGTLNIKEVSLLGSDSKRAAITVSGGSLIADGCRFDGMASEELCIISGSVSLTGCSFSGDSKTQILVSEKGTLSASKTTFMGSADTAVKSDGAAKVLLSSCSFTGSHTSARIYAASTSDLSIDRCTFSRSAVAGKESSFNIQLKDCPSVSISGCTAENTPSYHLSASKCGALSINKNRFSDAGSMPVYLLECENISFSDNTISGSKSSQLLKSENCGNVVLSKNTFNTPCSMAYVSDGCTSVSVSNCVFGEKASLYQIELIGNDTVKVNGCTFSGESERGISGDGDKNVTADNNRFSAFSNYPVILSANEKVSVTDNVISEAGASAIQVSAPAASVTGNTISDWGVSSSVSGADTLPAIYFTRTSKAEVTIRNNTIRRSASPAAAIILTETVSGSKTTVEKNSLGSYQPDTVMKNGDTAVSSRAPGETGGKPNSWIQSGKDWYYLNANAVPATGWLKINEKWYLLNGTGALGKGVRLTGWQKVGNTWYYLNSEGIMQTGWLKDGNTWYFLAGSGAMKTSWVQSSGKWYYMTGSGAMATNRWIQSRGKWYYCTGSGAMAVNTRIGNYRVDKNGVWVQ